MHPVPHGLVSAAHVQQSRHACCARSRPVATAAMPQTVASLPAAVSGGSGAGDGCPAGGGSSASPCRALRTVRHPTVPGGCAGSGRVQDAHALVTILVLTHTRHTPIFNGARPEHIPELALKSMSYNLPSTRNDESLSAAAQGTRRQSTGTKNGMRVHACLVAAIKNLRESALVHLEAQ